MSAEAAGVVTRTALPSRAAVHRRGAGDLARPPKRGITVAGQRRITTGLRWLYTGREYVPDARRIRLAADARSANAARE